MAIIAIVAGSACGYASSIPKIADPPTIAELSIQGVTNRAVVGYDWAPDGNDFAITTGDINQTQNDLISVNASGGKARVLVDHSSLLYLASPAYTRDGQGVLVNVTGHHQPGIWSLHLDSLQLSYVTPALLAVQSPDGKALAVAVGPAQGMNVPNWAIRVVDSTSGSIAQSIPLSGVSPIRVDSISWSPDSSKLAFSWTPGGYSGATPTQFLELYAVTGDIPTQWPQDLTNYIEPAWSPDGQYLAMVAVQARAATGRLVIWDLATGCEEQLTGVEGVISPKWSPDGTKLAFLYYFSIYVLDVKGARTSGRMLSICASKKP